MWIDKVKQTLLQGDSILFTANQRLQRYLLNTMCPNSEVFKNLPIYTIDQWVSATWLNLQDEALPGTALALINSAQESLIWSGLVEQYAPTAILNKRKLCLTLQEARTFTQGWQIPDEDLANHTSSESQFLVSMLRHFNQFLDTNELLTTEDAIKVIPEFYKGLYKQTYTYGFQDIPPLVASSLKSMSDTVTSLPHLRPASTLEVTSSRNAQAFAGVEDEYLAAAQWCKNLLEENVSKSIAVIVPGLEKTHTSVEKEFTKVFSPKFYTHPSISEPTLPFEISASSPLSSQPVVADALALIQLQQQTIEKQQALSIMQSRYWGGSSLRSEILDWISASVKKDISVAKLLARLEQISTEIDNLSPYNKDAKSFRTAMDLLRKFTRIKSNNVELRMTDWVNKLLALLEAFGWPGELDINSREYQAISQFIEQIHQLSNLGASTSGQKVQWDFIVNALLQLCGNKKFHIESEKKPIQILGPMEASGAVYDHVWLMNATSEQFPSRVSFNSLIPAGLQRQFSTPKSTPEKELSYAKSQLEGIISSTTDLTISFPLKDGDKEFQLTKLVEKHLDTIETNKPFPSELYQYYLASLEFNQLEYIHTTDGPEILEEQKIPGGASHIKLHAINPLLAFLVYRLKASSPAESYIGLTGADRGTLIHDILAAIWSNLKNHASLVALDTNELIRNITSVTSQTTKQFLASSDRDIDSTQLDIELKRTQKLIESWMGFEKTRIPFQVDSVEQKMKLVFDKRELSLRVDRIDSVNDHKIIMDYKTGKISLSQLTKNPILEPQLPLYLYGFDRQTNPIDGVCFSIVSHKELGLKGVCNETLETIEFKTADKIPKSEAPKQWHDLTEWWRETLNHQIQSIIRGDARFEENTNSPFYQYLTPIVRDFS